MEKQIKILKTMFECEQFVVTGSYALSKFGLIDQSSVMDIDIILVNPKESTKELAARLIKDNPAKTKPTLNGDVNAIFMFDGVKIDLFYTDKKQDSLELSDFEISKISTIVKAKKKYNRLKDWLQLRRLAKVFFNETEFNSYLNNVVTSGNESSY
jgi:hypothetical protein